MTGDACWAIAISLCSSNSFEIDSALAAVDMYQALSN